MTKAAGVAKRQPERRSQKRKLADTYPQEEPSPLAEIRRLIATLKPAGPRSDRTALKRAAHQLAEFCKQDELVDQIVQEGAIEAVVPLLDLAFAGTSSETDPLAPSTHEEIEKEACFILGLLAVKPEFQQKIAECGALKGLVRLLKEHRITSTTKAQPGSGGVARRAADAITNLAHENVEIKSLVKEQGGIPPLVALLDAWDIKVQRAAAGALRTLAFKNEENKNQIVECGALPTLIQMLRSEDVGVHYEAVGVIGNLVHSSSNIKRQVLEEGALQPVINLLSSNCNESQREAALLLGQFATTDADTKAKIVQRGAVPPLITMLSSSDMALKEMAAFALGRLAQNPDNQAGIVHAGGLKPLLELLDSKQPNLQHNAAFALYGLADNEDNIPDIIKEGGVQQLLESDEKLPLQASKDCISKTINRIATKLQVPKVLNHAIYMLRSTEKDVKERIATSLARLVQPEKLKTIFVDRKGIDVLLDMLTNRTIDPKMQREAAKALHTLASKVKATAPATESECPPQPVKTVYLGEQYVNNHLLADITFIVEGQKFYAHRIALLASSDAFRAMFNSGYREKEASTVDIPNIRYDVFYAMMQYMYTGNVQINQDIAKELLQAADQYLLDGLKRLCEKSIGDSVTIENLMEVYELSEAFSAPELGKICVMFALNHYDDVVANWEPVQYAEAMQRTVPLLKASLTEDLCRSIELAEERTMDPEEAEEIM